MLVEHSSLTHALDDDIQPWSPTRHSFESMSEPIAVRIAPNDQAMDYYLFVPPLVQVDKRPLVVVHGISRNARDHAQAFRAFSAASGRVLIAPVFARDGHRRYQRLGRDAVRADEALRAVLQQAAQRTGVDTKVVDLFGFSAGAQFAHRFAMLNPHRVGRLVLSSAGWFTDPARDSHFPYGIAGPSRLARAARKNLDQFLAIPMLVMVGEGDIGRDRNLRTSGKLDERQGYSRLERAGRWVNSLRRVADRRGVRTDIVFHTLPQCGHSFMDCVDRGGLVETMREWLERQP